MKSSKWYENREDGSLVCTLCPHHCSLPAGKTGICHVRTNRGGELISDNYGLISALHSDPIEKKPLYHFYPGSHIFSVGSVGCNLRCLYCQNCEISQVPSVDSVMGMQQYEPGNLVGKATAVAGNIGIAYTYNEPTVWYEFMAETAFLAKSCGLKNVMVTNGFINASPLEELLDVIDAFSVDIKGFTGEFYKKVTSSRLQPVKKAISTIARSGRHLELVNLVIPGMNDNLQRFREMVKWISGETGKQTVLHLSRYFPMYRMNIEPTPPALLMELHEVAAEYLDYVYLGNINSVHGNTHCPDCKSLVITRRGYDIYPSGLTDEGCCSKCGTLIIRHMN